MKVELRAEPLDTPFEDGEGGNVCFDVGRVEASRANAKIVFAWPLSAFVTNKIFLVRTLAWPLLVVIVGLGGTCSSRERM